MDMAGGSWDSMLAVIHADPYLAVDVRVRPAAGGDPIPCRMAWMTGDAAIPLMQTGTGSTTRIGEIRVAVLASVDEAIWSICWTRTERRRRRCGSIWRSGRSRTGCSGGSGLCLPQKRRRRPCRR
jgi:hypothetical protein